jgi:hypothetical protein
MTSTSQVMSGAQAAPDRRTGTRFSLVIRLLSWGAFAGAAVVMLAMLMNVLAIWHDISLAAPETVPPAFVDFNTYMNATARFLDGQSIYARAQLQGPYVPADVVLVGYVYPPPSILLFLLFRPGLLGLGGWLALNIGLLVGGMAMILRRELGLLWSTALATSVVALILFFTPFASGFLGGNVNVGVAGLLAVFWSLDRPSWVSVAAGVMGVTKIYPALLAVWVRRDDLFRSVALAFATAGALVVLTLPLVGIDAWRDFLIALSNAEPRCVIPSLTCALAPAIGATPATIIAVSASLGLVVLSLVARDRRARFLLLAYAMIAAVPDLYAHYLLIPFVAAFAAVANSLRPAFRRVDELRLQRP